MFRPVLDFHKLYAAFNEPVTEIDCGLKCAVHNPNRQPVCCDICLAVPCAYEQEWQYLQANSDLWHAWLENDCYSSNTHKQELTAEISHYQVLLACQGAAKCQRDFRAISCRQFPFFPYITADFRSIGLTYYWQYENTCWVISNLEQVSPLFRHESISFFDQLFDYWPDEMESYARLSESMRNEFSIRKQRIPVLHRNGSNYLLSPGCERMSKMKPSNYRNFGFYK